MIEVAQFLRIDGGRKSMKSGFIIKLIENNELTGKLFNENKEVSNLVSTIFLDN